MAKIVVRKLSEAAEERLRQRSAPQAPPEAEVRADVARAEQEALGAADAGEPFPEWFIRITRPGIDLDAAIEENRLQLINPWQHGP
jgi:hypothetical protein